MKIKQWGYVCFLVFLFGTGLVVGLHNQNVESIQVRPTQTISHQWTKADSLAYAYDGIMKNGEAQFRCLSNLWGKESAWDARAYNPTRVMGKTAGGIPQLLGLSPLTPPTEQIDRGLAYIYYRYFTPCKAWQHWQRNGWY